MYCIVMYNDKGNLVGVVAGMGKNRNTWDYDHSRSAAYRHLQKLRQSEKDSKSDKVNTYKVELIY